jgi:hypothetical protein
MAQRADLCRVPCHLPVPVCRPPAPVPTAAVTSTNDQVKAVAYPADRERLLASGEMCMPVYSSREPAEVARDSYRIMTDAADLMGLTLTEPVLEAGYKDWRGGRIVTVRAGVFDALGS